VLQTVLRLDVLKNLLLVNNNFGMPLVILKLSVCPLYTYISSIKLPNMLLTLVVFFLNIVFWCQTFIYTLWPCLGLRFLRQRRRKEKNPAERQTFIYTHYGPVWDSSFFNWSTAYAESEGI